jgi:hypothetical protein
MDFKNTVKGFINIINENNSTLKIDNKKHYHIEKIVSTVNNYFKGEADNIYIYFYRNSDVNFCDFFFTFKGKAYKKSQTRVLGFTVDDKTQISTLRMISSLFNNSINRTGETLPVEIKVSLKEGKMKPTISYNHKVSIRNKEIDVNFKKWFDTVNS